MKEISELGEKKIKHRRFNRKHNRKNDQVTVIHRRKLVASMYMEGMTMQSIADEIGESTSTVSKDIAYLRSVWRNDAKRDFDIKLGMELERLRRLDDAIWKQVELDGKVMQLKEGKFIQVGQRPVDPAYFEQLRKNCELRLKSMGAISGPNVLINNSNGGNSAQPSIWDVLSGAVDASKINPLNGNLLNGPDDGEESEEECEKLEDAEFDVQTTEDKEEFGGREGKEDDEEDEDIDYEEEEEDEEDDWDDDEDTIE